MLTAELIPNELRKRAEYVLEQGETIVWMGRPIPKAFTPLCKGLFIVGLIDVATTVPIFLSFSGGAQFDQSTWPLCLIPALFFIIGCLLLASPFVYYYFISRKMLYVITDRRLMTINPLSVVFSTAFRFEFLDDFRVVKRRDGSGDIVINSYTDENLTVNSTTFLKFGLLRVRNINDVEIILHEAIAASENQEEEEE